MEYCSAQVLSSLSEEANSAYLGTGQRMHIYMTSKVQEQIYLDTRNSITLCSSEACRVCQAIVGMPSESRAHQWEGACLSGPGRVAWGLAFSCVRSLEFGWTSGVETMADAERPCQEPI